MGNYKAGAAEVDITPAPGCHLTGYFEDRIAEKVNDPLSAKAIVISDGSNTIALVCLHLLAIPDFICDKVRKLVAEKSDIKPDAILISAVHTHTAPSISGLLGTPPQNGYLEALPQKIAKAVLGAVADMKPAELAHASGNCHEMCHNRRWRMRDGSYRMNPVPLDADAISPAGPIDPELGILVIREPETRKAIAVYSNLSLHYVGNGRGNWISADYFEDYAKALQRIAGEQCTVIMANGCQGDINNIDFKQKPDPIPPQLGPYYKQQKVANVIAAEAWRTWNLIREDAFSGTGTVDARLTRVPFHSRKATPQQLADAEKLYVSCDQTNFSEWIYARELVLLQKLPQDYSVVVQALRVGELGIAAFNGELFVEFGLQTKARSPYPQTMTVALANGYNGYTATDRALAQGSYETRLCRHVRAPEGTGQLWVDTAVSGLWDML